MSRCVQKNSMRVDQDVPAHDLAIIAFLRDASAPEKFRVWNFTLEQTVILFALREADCGEIVAFTGLIWEPYGDVRRGTFAAPRRALS
jgi:hypothetical protein